jgi:hypothetical protein
MRLSEIGTREARLSSAGAPRPRVSIIDGVGITRFAAMDHTFFPTHVMVAICLIFGWGVGLLSR